jgi:hypothetical protein
VPTESTYRSDGAVATKFIDADVKDLSKSAVDARMKGTNLGALGKKGKGPIPKQKDFATTSAWSAALKKWHDTPDAEVDGAKRALGRLGAK